MRKMERTKEWYEQQHMLAIIFPSSAAIILGVLVAIAVICGY